MEVTERDINLWIENQRETRRKKAKAQVQWDALLLVVITIIIFLYILLYFYAADLAILYQATCTLVQRTRARIARSLLGKRIRFLPVRSLPPAYIYPPHYHLDVHKEKHTLCTQNCFETLFRIRAQDHAPPERMYKLGEKWGLEMALRVDLEEIWHLSVRQVHVVLLQSILLWFEKQVETTKNKIKKKDWQFQLQDKVQKTFDAMFYMGNYTCQQIVESIRFPMTPEERHIFLLQLVPADAWFPYFKSPTYPFSPDKNFEQIQMTVAPYAQSTEKLERVQAVLQWMVLRYSPRRFRGIIGEKLYAFVRAHSKTEIKEHWFTQGEEYLIELIVDYLYFEDTNLPHIPGEDEEGEE
jgi:hypothetical protein